MSTSVRPLSPSEEYLARVSSISGRPRVWAGAVLLLAGLGLIGLAGCFLMGALSVVKPQLIDPKLQADPLSANASLLLGILYGVAGACLLGALVTIALGVRGLLRVLGERPALTVTRP